MPTPPARIFLDTNVYIVGASDPASLEWRILTWAGWEQARPGSVQIIVSLELIGQIRRVARRLRGKDWAGRIVNGIASEMNPLYVALDQDEYQQLEAATILPRNDVGMYLTARNGETECFISNNHELIRALVQHTGEFECLTPQEFVTKYLN